MMEEILKYEIPVWHPIVVHFPVAFILVAAMFAVIWAARNSTFSWYAAAVMTGLAFMSTFVAWWTGETMEEQSEGVPIVDELVHAHEDAAVITLWLAGVLLAVHCALLLARRTGLPIQPDATWVRWLVALVSVATVAAAAWTAHIGGTMVWGVAR